MANRAVFLPTPPTPKKGLLKLPWELRQRIYELVLLEPPKWEKTHRADCTLIALDTHTCERPPFVDSGLLYTSLAGCGCAKRQGLNLLLASRQVHAEAAPVLWSGNVFCFTKPQQVAPEIGGQLRSAYRQLLRHVALLTYNADSLPGQVVYGMDPAEVGKMWDMLLQCTGLRTLELSHYVFDGHFETMGRIRKQLPELRSLKITTLMAYRLLPRTDQSAPLPRVSWRTAGGAGSSSRSNGRHDDDDDDDASQTAPPPPQAFVPWAGAVPAPPPPPPAERYLVLSPHLAGYEACNIRDVSRTLWLKSGYELDVDAAASRVEAYNDAVRSFRTNFLVHLRHAIGKLPEAWARDYQMGAASLRTPWTLPPAPLPRRSEEQVVDPSQDTASWESDILNALMNIDAAWDPDHGTCYHHPEAIRLIAGRLPLHMRDGPYWENNIVLRDGRAVPVQIMGLPISKAMRTYRARQRKRIERAKHAAGERTAREEREAAEARARREAKAMQRRSAATRDPTAERRARARRLDTLEEARKAEDRAARAAARTLADEQQKALAALRKAARQRLFVEEEADEGSEAGTEDDDGGGAAAPKTPTAGRPLNTPIVLDAAQKETRKQMRTTPWALKKKAVRAPKAVGSGKAGLMYPVRASSARQQGRLAIYHALRDGEYDEYDEHEYDEYDEHDGHDDDTVGCYDER